MGGLERAVSYRPPRPCWHTRSTPPGKFKRPPTHTHDDLWHSRMRGSPLESGTVTQLVFIWLVITGVAHGVQQQQQQQQQK